MWRRRRIGYGEFHVGHRGPVPAWGTLYHTSCQLSAFSNTIQSPSTQRAPSECLAMSAYSAVSCVESWNLITVQYIASYLVTIHSPVRLSRVTENSSLYVPFCPGAL